jgi:threonine/homoserine/homoserine lactone efflux protein
VLLAFIGVSLLVIVTPGQDTALTVRNTLIGGRRAGLFTALGVASGLAFWAVTASAGVTALLVASEPAFLALKLGGAAYLVWLGIQSLRAAARGSSLHADADVADRRPPGRFLRQGLISDLGNPKIAVFFTSLLPQFTPHGGGTFLPLLGLGLLFCALTLVWLTLYSIAVARARDLLSRTRVRRAFDAVMGATLVALGVRLAAEHR